MAHTQQKRAVPGLGSSSQVDSPAHDRFCWLLLALVGQSVTVTLRGGTRVRGILASSTPDSADLSISLRQTVDLHAPPSNAPKPSLLINGRDILEIEAADVALDLEGKSDASAQATSSSRERDSFRTDTDISGAALLGKERQLQAWGASAGGGIEDSIDGGIGGLEDEGLGRSSKGAAGGRGWDQFAANERQFGLRTDYDDELYTTKLDRSGADYKERERRAAQLEREILKGGSALANNAHVAEERGEQLPEIENEEDRYGAVIRGEGAYVPPGARKAAAARVAQQQNGTPAPADKAAPSTPAGTSRLPQPTSATSRIPTVPSSGSSATSSTTARTAPAPAPTAVAAASTAPNAAASGTSSTAKPYQRSFQDFVTNERVRLEQKRAQMAQAQQQAQQQQQQALKKEQDSKLASLVQWSQTFKNPYPLSEDVAAIMGKKPGSTASHDAAKKAGSSIASNASPAVSPANTTRTLPAPTPSPTPSSANALPHAPTLKLAKPLLPEIPPFDPARAKARQAELAAQKNGMTTAASAVSAAAPTTTSTASADAALASSLKPKAPTTKLSAKSAAFVFKPNPNATSFTPGASTSSSSAAPAPAVAAPAVAVPAPASAPAPSAANATPRKPAEPQAPPNPFFGNKVIKRGSSSMHVKEDFTPFKNGVLPEPSTVPPSWQFSGKPYRSIYPIPPQTAASAAASVVDDSASSIAGSLPGPGGIVDPNNAAAIAAAQAQAHAAAASGVPLGMMHPHQPHGAPPHFPPQMAAALAASQGGPASHIPGGPLPPHVAGMAPHGGYNIYQMAAMAANANGGPVRGFPGQPGPGMPQHGAPHHPHPHPHQHQQHHPGQMQHPPQHLMPGAGGPPVPPPPFAPQFAPGQGPHGGPMFPSSHIPPSSASVSPHISHPSPAASHTQVPGQAGAGGPPGRYMPWTPAGFVPGQHGGPTPPPQNGPVPPHPGPPPQFVQQQQQQ